METLVKALPPGQNRFKDLLIKENLHGKKLQMATFLLVLQDKDTWADFAPRHYPYPPTGYDRAFADYKSQPEEKKSTAWKSLLKEYGDYISRLAAIKDKNWSNLLFLDEMMTFFQKEMMMSKVEIVNGRMLEYEYDYERFTKWKKTNEQI